MYSFIRTFLSIALAGVWSTTGPAQSSPTEPADGRPFYLTLGLGWARATAGAFGEAAVPGIDVVAPFATLGDATGTSLDVGLRVEALEAVGGSEPYSAPGSPFDGADVYAAIRSQSIGLQLGWGGRARVRPYGALSIARVTMVLDADEDTLERDAGVGALLRAGTYVAFSRGPTPFVLDLGAAYHINGTRDYWVPGDVVAKRGRVDLFELSIRIGIASHR